VYTYIYIYIYMNDIEDKMIPPTAFTVIVIVALDSVYCDR
jgi:hypothetical protein